MGGERHRSASVHPLRWRSTWPSIDLTWTLGPSSRRSDDEPSRWTRKWQSTKKSQTGKGMEKGHVHLHRPSLHSSSFRLISAMKTEKILPSTEGKAHRRPFLDLSWWKDVNHGHVLTSEQWASTSIHPPSTLPSLSLPTHPEDKQCPSPINWSCSAEGQGGREGIHRPCVEWTSCASSGEGTWEKDVTGIGQRCRRHLARKTSRIGSGAVSSSEGMFEQREERDDSKESGVFLSPYWSVSPCWRMFIESRRRRSTDMARNKERADRSVHIPRQLNRSLEISLPYSESLSLLIRFSGGSF